MKRSLTVAISIGILVCLTGCAAVIVGAGAGAGTAAYIQGALIRTYQNDYERTLSACMRVIDDLGINIQSKTTDGVQTVIKATRKDETPMTVKVKIAGNDWTEVSVRTGYVGLWKKEVSEQFHAYVARKLE